MNKEKESRVLLVIEDNEEDFYSTKRAFTKVHLESNLMHCEDAETALDYLFRKNQYSDPATSPTPNLILLDLNLPGTDGREVIKQIKREETLRSIPLVVLTTSNDERDIEYCYAMGANSYIQKPIGFNNFIHAVQILKYFWFDVALLPKTLC